MLNAGRGSNVPCSHRCKSILRDFELSVRRRPRPLNNPRPNRVGNTPVIVYCKTWAKSYARRLATPTPSVAGAPKSSFSSARCDPAKASDLAENLRHRIIQTNFVPESRVAVTASFDVATSPAVAASKWRSSRPTRRCTSPESRPQLRGGRAEDQMRKITGARKGTWALISGRFRLRKSLGGRFARRLQVALLRLGKRKAAH